MGRHKTSTLESRNILENKQRCQKCGCAYNTETTPECPICSAVGDTAISLMPAVAEHFTKSQFQYKVTSSLCWKCNQLDELESHIIPLKKAIHKTLLLFEDVSALSGQLDLFQKQWDKIFSKHRKCAACGILLGEGHIQQIYDRWKGQSFCLTCPKKVLQYNDDTEED